ncbi:MAG: D-glycero-beta-D-manno-heptose 1,7-bisphosphate 7-phosphatase [Candidatus Omnitrophota bacterium]
MKTVFLDRDGVINKDPGGWTKYNYVTTPDEFQFLPGSLGAIKKLSENDFRIIVVSNQAGVAKGYFTEAALDRITSLMLRRIEESGGTIEKVYYCVHRNEDNCDCRKPKEGLIIRAAEEYSIDLSDCVMIGDGASDITAGKKAGLTTVLVLSGKSTAEDAGSWSEKPDYIFKDLREAADWLIQEGR